MKGDWPLFDFEQRADEWAERENPSLRQRLAVFEWIERLRSDPYFQATPMLDVGPPWWFAVIRKSSEDGFVVTCTMQIDEERMRSTCSHFVTLSLPL